MERTQRRIGRAATATGLSPNAARDISEALSAAAVAAEHATRMKFISIA
jgi:hypothetical protein